MRRFVWLTGLVLAFILSGALAYYGWWVLQIEKGNSALRQGEVETALEIYEKAEWPFQWAPWLARILSDDYQKLVFNRISILYGARENDAVIKKLEQEAARAPFLSETAEYSFWMGNVLLRRAVRAKNPQATVNDLKAALAEYQKGLMAQPEDWDLKYNYELLLSVLSRKGRDESKEEERVKSLLDKMRPQVEPQKEQLAPEKRG